MNERRVCRLFDNLLNAHEKCGKYAELFFVCALSKMQQLSEAILFMSISCYEHELKVQVCYVLKNVSLLLSLLINISLLSSNWE